VSRDMFMRRAIALALENAQAGRGGPFGAVVVNGGRIAGEGANRVTATLDPTAHAEVVAIRAACVALGRFDLRGCDLYTSCEPCPMCLSAAYWARVDRLYYAADRGDAARAGFDDDVLYREVALAPGMRSMPTIRLLPDEAHEAFAAWARNPDRVPY
jgi:guanine deaminase